MGNIGVGKSTFLERMQRTGRPVVPEPLSKWVFFPKFLADPKEYAFRFQAEVLTSMPAVLDSLMERCPLESMHVFAANLASSGVLSSEDAVLLNTLSVPFLWVPYQVLYFHAPPSVCFARIQARARPGEDYSLAYIEQVHAQYENLICSLRKTAGVEVITIDCTSADIDSIAQRASVAFTL
jgi:deoxyadenosine/deoxycytidine kinase